MAGPGTTHPATTATPRHAGTEAFVNIHHFCMDAVIWRRDNPSTRYLTRAEAAQNR